ncbi:class A beta-lactamase [Streptomyces sp. Z26]|uniref:class A beta-lactamase n=1 Tax=Streptomyces sp. Z26 TaxID=2500177 RepID=UPI001F0C29B0|nr:class A beta-lactamase [Streptomyces sp. Z26]
MSDPRFSRTTRAALAALLLASLAGCGSGDGDAASAAPAAATSEPTGGPGDAAETARAREEFDRLEGAYDARLGVYAVDTATGRELTYRADDRFAFASTFKALLTGTGLQRDSVKDLEKRLTYDRDDLVPNSPITEKHVDTGISVRGAMDAAVRYSDNTAANLLFREYGGPDAFEAALRRIGDRTTRSDRIETALNETTPGDPRDTSTPRAMADSLRAFTVGKALPVEKRKILTTMLRENTTGGPLIRAGAPEGWVVGDKTGAADYGTRNDIAVIWPPGRAPVMLAVLSDKDTKDAEYDDALVADAAKAALAVFR